MNSKRIWLPAALALMLLLTGCAKQDAPSAADAKAPSVVSALAEQESAPEPTTEPVQVSSQAD